LELAQRAAALLPTEVEAVVARLVRRDQSNRELERERERERERESFRRQFTCPQAFRVAEELYLIGGVYLDTQDPGRIT
jgi:hypothetical protein